MAALTNTKWELFALALSRGRSQKEAYEEAGFSGDSTGNQSTLAKRPEIRARVEELIQAREEAAGRGMGPDSETQEALDHAARTGEISATWIILQLMENVAAARGALQFSAANKALELLGKEIGMFQDKPKDAQAADEQKKLEAQKRSAIIPLDKMNEAIKAVLAGTPIRPNLPALSNTVSKPKSDPLREVRRTARMGAMPRDPKSGAILKSEFWTDDDRKAIQDAIDAAVSAHLEKHPEDAPEASDGPTATT